MRVVNVQSGTGSDLLRIGHEKAVESKITGVNSRVGRGGHQWAQFQNNLQENKELR
jgi:hypothetical protein